MPKRNSLLFAPVAAMAALATLSGCTSESASGDPSAITGDATFLEIIGDARAAMRNGQLAEAGSLYDEARALDPENPGLWVDIARLRFLGGEHLIAIEAADYALALDREYAPALLMRAQLVRDAHGLAESLPWFEAAVTADPRNSEILADYAATLGDLGYYKDMLGVVGKLAEISPNHPKVFYLQAVLAARGDKPTLASNLLNRSGQAQRGVPAAMMLSAIVDMQQGNYDTAYETLDQLKARQPANMRVDELIARALWLNGRDRELVSRFGEAAMQSEASPYLVMLVGRAMERMGNREQALPFIQSALEQRPVERIALSATGQGSERLPAITARMRGQVRSGNASGAQASVASALERARYSGDLRALAGDALLAQGNAQGALQEYEISARVRRSWPLTRKMIEAFNATGDIDAADYLLTRYITGDPHNSAALTLFAQSSARREDWLRVSVLLDNAIALGAGNDLEVLALRAQAARELGEEEDAARFEEARSHLSPGGFLEG